MLIGSIFNQSLTLHKCNDTYVTPQSRVYELSRSQDKDEDGTQLQPQHQLQREQHSLLVLYKCPTNERDTISYLDLYHNLFGFINHKQFNQETVIQTKAKRNNSTRNLEDQYQRIHEVVSIHFRRQEKQCLLEFLMAK